MKIVRALILAALAGAILLGSVFYGFLVREEKLPPFETMEQWHYALRQDRDLRALVFRLRGKEQGTQWHRADPPRGASTGMLSADELEQLAAIGYLSGSEAAPSTTGVTHVSDAASPGLNLYNSGHGTEAILTDLRGEVLHTWQLSFEEAFPDTVPPAGSTSPEHWRRVLLLPNGDLLALFEGLGMIRIDKDSKLLWSSERGEHHDMQVTPDGRIWVLTRTAHVNESFNPKRPILEDFVTVLSPEGDELASVSILDAFQASHFASLLEFCEPSGDIFHTNSLEVLDGRFAERSSALAAGNVLLSLNHLNAVVIMDFDKAEIVWALTGFSNHQHDAELTPEGNLLFLDNRGNGGFSKVVELDPASHALVWGYFGDERNGFVTEASGAQQRLPNGNTLIIESNAGRAFEVDRDGLIAWEFFNPHRAGDDGELIATLFDVQRIPPDFPLDWLGEAP